ncbi:molybdopterin-guanine dinucleotide biosynthesis protein A [Ruegeria sp. R11]|nr:molybdopterin-guanine dinucleotide biosynthesis protein A [Ruegeria sp. R11]
MTQPLGVILAGGLATRMGGGDKGRLQVGGESLLARVVDRIAPQVAGLALNANGDPQRFDDLGLPVIADTIDGFAGPLAGVLAGLDWAAEQGASSIVTVAADTPFFPQIWQSGCWLRLRGSVIRWCWRPLRAQAKRR